MAVALANIRPMAQRKIRALSSSAAGIAGTVESRKRDGALNEYWGARPPGCLLCHLRRGNRVERRLLPEASGKNRRIFACSYPKSLLYLSP